MSRRHRVYSAVLLVAVVVIYASRNALQPKPVVRAIPVVLARQTTLPKLPVLNGAAEKVTSEAIGLDEKLMFATADISLEGNGWGFSARFDKDNENEEVPASLKKLILQRADAVWVRGRLESLFQFRNKKDKERTEKTFSEVGMVAVINEGDRRYLLPFFCTDHYGRTGLMFSEPSPDAKLIETVSQAFWKLLLSEPEQLNAYSDTMYHSGAGVYIDYGVSDGQPWMKERH